jgi:hypothetical protein
MENNKVKVGRFNHTCELCNYVASRPSEWLVHIESEKHKRNGKTKTKICNICNIEFKTHWIQKMHKLKIHASTEERAKMNYYCKECDLVFISKLYLDKHIEGKIHKNLIKALATLN